MVVLTLFCRSKIFILNIAKIDDSNYKITFLPNFNMFNENYKGYFIDEMIVKNDFLFKNFTKKDFKKWYGVGLDYDYKILCLYYKTWKINL